MNEIESMHRSMQLQPLSREHHDGLLFAWRIRQGVKMRVDIERLRNYVNWYWKLHIKPHFFQEEKVIIPFIPIGHSMVEKLQTEHQEIRELIIAIDRNPDVEDIKQLGILIENHIRWEERFFFQFLEENLSVAQLTEIGEKIKESSSSPEISHGDIFW